MLLQQLYKQSTRLGQQPTSMCIYNSSHPTQPHLITLLLNIWGQYILIIISITEGCRKLKTVRTDYNVLEHTFIILIICYTCNMYLKPLRC